MGNNGKQWVTNFEAIAESLLSSQMSSVKNEGMVMTLHQLVLLIAVADHGSISGAATTLNMAQPTITYQIRALEQELGQPLLERQPRGVSLTSAGKIVVSEGRKVLEVIAGIPNKIEQRLAQVHGEVMLGMSPVTPFSTHHFPAVYRLFHEYYPGIKVTVIEERSEKMQEMIRKGQIDIAVLALPINGWKLNIEPLWKEKLVVILPVGRSLEPSYHIHSLKNEQFVMMRPEYSLAQRISAMAQHAGFLPKISVEVASLGALVGFVRAGMGISIVPRELAQSWESLGYVCVAELDPPQDRQLALVSSKNSPMNLEVSLFAKSLRAYAQEISSEGIV